MNEINSIFETRYFSIGNSKITVGSFSYGIENVSVMQWGEGACLTIGSFCSISTNVKVFLGGNHRIDWITTFPFGHIFIDELGGKDIQGHPATNGDVVIGNDVWLAHGVTIMSGVSIGDGAVVAANAHVVNNVPPYCIVGGNPAKEIRYRFNLEIRQLLFELSWWDLPLQVIKSITSDLSQEPNTEILEDMIKKFRNNP